MLETSDSGCEIRRAFVATHAWVCFRCRRDTRAGNRGQHRDLQPDERRALSHAVRSRSGGALFHRPRCWKRRDDRFQLPVAGEHPSAPGRFLWSGGLQHSRFQGGDRPGPAAGRRAVRQRQLSRAGGSADRAGAWVRCRGRPRRRRRIDRRHQRRLLDSAVWPRPGGPREVAGRWRSHRHHRWSHRSGVRRHAAGARARHHASAVDSRGGRARLPDLARQLDEHAARRALEDQAQT